MNPYALFVIAGLCAATASACGSTDMMNDAQSSMHEALTSAEAENDRHLSACQQADSMWAMVAELDLHDANMAPVMERMDRALGGMAHCSGDFQALSVSETQMRTALSDHARQIRSSETPAAARKVCSEHASLMTDMMDGMMTGVAGMSCMGMHR